MTRGHFGYPSNFVAANPRLQLYAGCSYHQGTEKRKTKISLTASLGLGGGRFPCICAQEEKPTDLWEMAVSESPAGR